MARPQALPPQPQGYAPYAMPHPSTPHPAQPHPAQSQPSQPQQGLPMQTGPQYANTPMPSQTPLQALPPHTPMQPHPYPARNSATPNSAAQPYGAPMLPAAPYATPPMAQPVGYAPPPSPVAEAPAPSKSLVKRLLKRTPKPDPASSAASMPVGAVTAEKSAGSRTPFLAGLLTGMALMFLGSTLLGGGDPEPASFAPEPFAEAAPATGTFMDSVTGEAATP
jgi:hypothetical protein